MRGDFAPAGVVDEDVESAPAIFDGLHHGAHFDVLSDIGLMDDRLASGVANGCDDFLCLVLGSPIVDEDLRALRREKLRDAAAHPGSRAGDDRHPSFELHT